MAEDYDKRIEVLEARLVKIKDQKKKAEKKRVDMENEKKRKLETRKKVLLGAAVLAQAQKDARTGEWLKKLLSVELKREDDRRLFGLDVRPEQKPEAQ